MKYCINTAMYNQDLGILEKIKIAAKSGFDAIEPWIYELENINLKDVVNCCKDYNIKVSSVEVLYGWFENDGGLMGVENNHQSIMDECKRRIEISKNIESKFIIAAPSFSHRGFTANWEQGVNYFKEILDLGKSMGCIPSIEFMGQTEQIKTFELCKSFINDVGNDATMIIDAYHCWKSGGSVYDFDGFDKDRISVLHISDADKNIKREDHMDRNRVMILDGQIDLMGFAKTAKKIGFDGFVNVGVYNKSLWKLNPYDMSETIINRLNEIFI